ncbi:hypothetical protein NE452_16430 [Paeniclostridium sordellii]|nr:hypothetical protein [Paeniclostridium sordellii]
MMNISSASFIPIVEDSSYENRNPKMKGTRYVVKLRGKYDDYFTMDIDPNTCILFKKIFEKELK